MELKSKENCSLMNKSLNIEEEIDTLRYLNNNNIIFSNNTTNSIEKPPIINNNDNNLT